jgi:hypothetical protein
MIDRPRRLASLLVALALLCAAGPAAAQHPTAVTSILNSEPTPDTTLEVNHNGSLLMPGTDNTSAPNDSIPTEGAGTRLMWYPAKSAFRVGEISGRQWNAENVGSSSVAFGFDTKASAGSAVAFGNGTTASTEQATAMGDQTTASGAASTAMGRFTFATGNQATAMGFLARAATDYSLSIGQCNSTSTSADNTLFVAGNGSFSNGSCSRSDALVLDRSGNLTISGSLTQNSDRRLKTGIEPLEGDILEKLADLRPVRYEFKNQEAHPSGEQIGLIAQDVQKEFPQLVREGSGGMLSLAYPKLTAILLKGVQEQQAELETKKQEIAKLKAENEEIKERLAALERQHSSALPAGLAGPLGLAILFGFGGLIVGLLWRQHV